MESSEQDQPPAPNEVFYSMTANADMSWYHYWPSHPGSSAIYYPQMGDYVPGHWTHHADRSQSGSHSSAPPTQFSWESWDALGQGPVDYEHVGGDSVYSSSQVTSGVALQTSNDQSSHHHEPSSTIWYPSSGPSAFTVTSSRRPSRCSDPGLPTTSQDNSDSHLHSNPLLDSGSGIAVAPEVVPQSTEERSPSDPEPSPPVGPNSGSGHVGRPAIRCWDHGCGGRKFSSISNYRRHQRERAGQTTVCFCPRCGAAFYRRWTRDHHVERNSCLRFPRSS